MFRFKRLFRFLAVWFGVVAIVSISSASAFAAEKLAPAGSKQGPEIFVQLASIIYLATKNLCRRFRHNDLKQQKDCL